MKQGRELAKRCQLQWKFERVQHSDGDFSFEMHDDGRLVSIAECNFKKRADAKRMKDFIEYHSPERMIALYDKLDRIRNAIDVLRGSFVGRKNENVFKIISIITGALDGPL